MPLEQLNRLPSVSTHSIQNKIEEAKIVELVEKNFELKPKKLIEMLDLKKPIYQLTASYGHFGREEESFSWESTDKIEQLK